MTSKTTIVKKSFTCPYCGSHEYTALPGQGAVAGKLERKIVCLKCGKSITSI